MAKNLCAKTRPKYDPYEVWANKVTGWTWYVLKKWQADDNKPGARWFCNTTSPIVPQGELGDEYVSVIKENGLRIK